MCTLPLAHRGIGSNVTSEIESPASWLRPNCDLWNFAKTQILLRVHFVCDRRDRAPVFTSHDNFVVFAFRCRWSKSFHLFYDLKNNRLKGWSVFCLSTTYSIVQRHCSNVEASVHLNIAGSVRTAVDGVIVEYKIPNVLCGTICDYDLFTDNGQCHQATCVMSRIVQDCEREYLTVLTCRDSPRIIADVRVAEFELNEFLQLPGYNALSPKIFHGSYVCPVIMRAYYQHNP